MKFMIEGLDCASCAAKIEKKLNADAQVATARLNFVTKTVEVDFRAKFQEPEALEFVRKTVHAYEPHTHVYTLKEYESHDHHLMEPLELALTAFGILLFIASFFMETYRIPVLVVAYLAVGWDILYAAALNIRKGEIFDENFLMLIATLAAFYIGEITEAVGVFIFYKIGEVFESIAVGKARSAIDTAKEQLTGTAAVVNPFDGKVKITPVEQVRRGDVVQLLPGERLMFDGTMTTRGGLFDPSALTGESLPIAREKGESVVSGYINLDRPAQMRVDTVYADSTYAKIVELVDAASGNRSETEKFITRFARIYTPVVVLLATLLVIIPTVFLGGSLDTWLYRGAIFLVVSCPCALVISIPLVYYIALGRAAHSGIIIKGSRYLDLIRRIEHFVFDKTGTLTQGEFEVEQIIGSLDTLRYAALGEAHSTHPIARAIVRHAGEVTAEEKLLDVEEIRGLGIRYRMGGKQIVLGNQRMMEQAGIDVNTPDTGSAVVHVAVDGAWLGSITLRDQLKPQAAALLGTLAAKTVHLLSGDHPQAVKEVAGRLGIRNARSEMLPQDKLTYVENLDQVCFIGDGINDGPVMARADLGISMGNRGSDLAIEQSQIVILDDDIGKIRNLIDLSARVRVLVVQNIVLALGIKIGVMILGAIGYSSMGMAIFADVGVAVLAILNAIRLNY